LRDIEVYITHDDTFPAHALQASIEEATKKCLWLLDQDGRIPNIPALKDTVRRFQVSAKRTVYFEDSFNTPAHEEVTYNHTHTMERAIETTSLVGFMLRDLNYELCARFTDELLLNDQYAKHMGSPNIANRAKLGAHIGEGNKHFIKYAITGRVYLIIREIVHQAQQNIASPTLRIQDNVMKLLIS
jgi:hypothetical protein